MKFLFDNSKIILTEHAQQLVELYKEYLCSSELMKKVIINHIRQDYRMHSSRILSWINGEISLDSFENNVKDTVGFTKNNIDKEKYEAAKEFVDSRLSDIDFITCGDKITYDVIIVRKMIGIKSTTVRQHFIVPDNKTDKQFFDANLDYIKWFMNHYVRKLIMSGKRTSTNGADVVEALKKKGVNINVTDAPTGRYLNIYVNYEIKLKDLSYAVLDIVKEDIALLDGIFI